MDFGSILVKSETVPYSDFMSVRVKLFTNADGLPEFKVWANNVSDTATPVNWLPTGLPTTSSYVDTLNRFPYAGFTGVCFGNNGTNLVGEVRHGINKAVLTTEDAEGKIYIRTLVGEGAEDSVVYNSAMELFFDPV
jgi:hypothetical protein